MAKPKMTETQRARAIEMLAAGHNRARIAREVGINLQQVAALKAHVTMGTYDPAEPGPTFVECPTCRGIGAVTMLRKVSSTAASSYGPSVTTREPCPKCQGTGKLEAVPVTPREKKTVDPAARKKRRQAKIAAAFRAAGLEDV